MCLFGVAKPTFNIYNPFSLKNAILGPNFDGKTALTLDVLRVNGP